MTWIAVEISQVNAAKFSLLSEYLFSLDADGVEEDGQSLKAYFDNSKTDIETLNTELKKQPLLKSAAIDIREIPETNWNEEWEKNYEPVLIESQVFVRAFFHQIHPKAPYDLLINPKMSFGTAHHATTHLMIQYMLKLDFSQKKVLDFGCGTAILGILAEKMGASEVFAIDIDEWAYKNGIENCRENNCEKTTIKQGSAEDLPDERYDVILANINKNVLLENVSVFNQKIKDSGLMLLSGLLKSDEDEVRSVYEKNGFSTLETLEKENWICIALRATHK